MKFTKGRIFLTVIAIIILVLAGVMFYFYSQGSAEHYVPPVADEVAPDSSAIDDLTALSKAVEAYNGMNLKYPDRLDELVPDFIAKLPVVPGSGNAYSYKTDGTSNYSVEVADPSPFKLKKLMIENGKLVKE